MMKKINSWLSFFFISIKTNARTIQYYERASLDGFSKEYLIATRYNPLITLKQSRDNQVSVYCKHKEAKHFVNASL